MAAALIKYLNLSYYMVEDISDEKSTSCGYKLSNVMSWVYALYINSNKPTDSILYLSRVDRKRTIWKRESGAKGVCI